MGRFLDYIKSTGDLFSYSSGLYEDAKEQFLKNPKGVMKAWLDGEQLDILNYLFSWDKFDARTGFCSEREIRAVYEGGSGDLILPTNRFYQLLLKELSPTRPLKNYFPEIVSDV